MFFDGLSIILSSYLSADFYVALLAVITLMLGVFRLSDKTKLLSQVSAGLLIVIALLTFNNKEVYKGIYYSEFSYILRYLIIGLTALVLLMMPCAKTKLKFHKFETVSLVLFALFGCMLMLSAASFLVLYIAIEMQALVLYVLAASNRDDSLSSEAGLKYFILSAISSGLMLYGISLIYAFTGSISFDGLKALINNDFIDIMSLPIAITIGFVMFLIGIFFKLSIAPFHMWTPDVYEGSPTLFTAFFASVPKIAVLGALVGLFDVFFTKWLPKMQSIITFVAVISLYVGAFGAIKQTQFKKIMAYSSIGNMGFVLLGLLNSKQMLLTTGVYAIIYGITVLGAFAVVTAIENSFKIESIQDLAGLSKTSPVAALILAITMFSMAGIPPLAGFFAKLVILESLIDAGMVKIAVLAVISSVISAYYYLNIVKIMYFDEVHNVISFRISTGNRLVAAMAGSYNLLYILLHSAVLGLFLKS